MSEVMGKEKDKEGEGVILDATQLEKEDLEKLKGDKIGESAYSGKWVVDTLLSLSKIEEKGWDANMEKELCTLWDCSTEKDVVKFLIENDFLKVAEFSLISSEENRLTEIIIGIIGNLICDPEILEKFQENETLFETILRHFSSEDSAILLQILRLLKSPLWKIQQSPSDSKWRDILRNSTFLREVVPFILKSSTNEELLMATTNFLRSSAEIELNNKTTLLDELFEPSSLLTGMFESFEEVFSEEEMKNSSTNLKYLEDWLELFSHLRKDNETMQQISIDPALSRMIEIYRKILQNFTEAWNLFPLDETRASCVHHGVETLLDFRWKGFINHANAIDIDRSIFSIILNIDTARKEGEEDPEEIMKELSRYLEYYVIEISNISPTEISSALKVENFENSQKVLKYLKSIIPAEKMDKIIEALNE